MGWVTMLGLALRTRAGLLNIYRENCEEVWAIKAS